MAGRLRARLSDDPGSRGAGRARESLTPYEVTYRQRRSFLLRASFCPGGRARGGPPLFGARGKVGDERGITSSSESCCARSELAAPGVAFLVISIPARRLSMA